LSFGQSKNNYAEIEFYSNYVRTQPQSNKQFNQSIIQRRIEKKQTNKNMDERKFLQEKERRKKVLEEICCYLETRKKVSFSF
jgi:hypothetical protein